MKTYRRVAAFILAGGASSRMGRDKGLIELASVPLVVRTALLLDRLVAEVTVVGAVERYRALGLKTIPDQSQGEGVRRGQGPLVGIATALGATRAPWNLILACDLPYLSVEWLSWRLARASGSRAQVVLPRTLQGLEPLAALYRRECAEPIVAALTRGVRTVTDALRDLRVEPVDEREWRAYDPGGRILRNMNTPEDYKEAQVWWESQVPRVHRGIMLKRKPQAAPRRRR